MSTRRSSPSMTPRVAIIVSTYNASITSKLLAGAVAEYERGTGRGTPDVFPAPGAFELPALSLAAASTGRYDGVVALGCLIKGETRHDRVIADAVAEGLVNVTIATGVPVAFGVLTVEDAKQAKARAGGSQGNKGQEAMAALLATIAARERIVAGSPAGVDALFAKAKDKAGRDSRRTRGSTAGDGR